MGLLPPKGSTQATLVRQLKATWSYQDWDAAKGKLVEKEYVFNKPLTVAGGTKSPNPKVGPAKPKGWKPCKNYSRSSGTVQTSGVIVGYKKETLTRPRLYNIQNHYRNDPELVINCPGSSTPFNIYGNYPWMDSNKEAQLITECLNKVQDRKVNYGEALAESRKTITHLAKTVLRLLKLYKGVKTANPKLIAEGLGFKKGAKKGLSGNWLEYQYGWMPLMSDISDTYSLANKGFENRQLIRAVRNIGDSNIIGRKYNSGTGLQVSISGSDNIVDRCILFYELDQVKLKKLGQLGLINPLEVAWAVVPFSFVLDWVLPVGNFLQATTATLGTKFVDGCLSRSVKGLRTLTVDDANMDAYPFRKEETTYIGMKNFDHFTRVKIVSAPTPRLYYKSPFSTNHAISAVALLAQLRR